MLNHICTLYKHISKLRLGHSAPSPLHGKLSEPAPKCRRPRQAPSAPLHSPLPLPSPPEFYSAIRLLHLVREKWPRQFKAFVSRVCANVGSGGKLGVVQGSDGAAASPFIHLLNRTEEAQVLEWPQWPMGPMGKAAAYLKVCGVGGSGWQRDCKRCGFRGVGVWASRVAPDLLGVQSVAGSPGFRVRAVLAAVEMTEGNSGYWG